MLLTKSHHLLKKKIPSNNINHIKLRALLNFTGCDKTLGMAYNCWLCCVMKASFSLLLHQAHLIHHPEPISVIWWEKCGASGSPSIPISENEKTNNRTWLGLIAKDIMVFTDSLLVEQHGACLRNQMWFKGCYPNNA